MEKFKNAEPPDEQDLIDSFVKINKCRIKINGRMHEISITKDFAEQIHDIYKTQAKPQ